MWNLKRLTIWNIHAVEQSARYRHPFDEGALQTTCSQNSPSILLDISSNFTANPPLPPPPPHFFLHKIVCREQWLRHLPVTLRGWLGVDRQDRHPGLNRNMAFVVDWVLTVKTNTQDWIGIRPTWLNGSRQPRLECEYDLCGWLSRRQPRLNRNMTFTADCQEDRQPRQNRKWTHPLCAGKSRHCLSCTRQH